MLNKKNFSALSLVIISVVILSACAAPAAPETVVQTVVQVQTVVVPGTPETVIVYLLNNSGRASGGLSASQFVPQRVNFRGHVGQP